MKVFGFLFVQALLATLAALTYAESVNNPQYAQEYATVFHYLMAATWLSIIIANVYWLIWCVLQSRPKAVQHPSINDHVCFYCFWWWGALGEYRRRCVHPSNRAKPKFTIADDTCDKWSDTAKDV